jgi:hypothetical protein
MTGLEIKGRLDRIGKTALEHFQDIKELEVADGPEIKVEDIVPYKCEQVEKSLKALEIINEKNVDIRWIEVCDTVKDYNKGRDEHLNYELTLEEFNLLKEVLGE